jgi:hypothetical protein
MLACTKLQYFGFYLVMFAFIFSMMLRVRVTCWRCLESPERLNLRGLSQLIPVLIPSLRPSDGTADRRVRTIFLEVQYDALL